MHWRSSVGAEHRREAPARGAVEGGSLTAIRRDAEEPGVPPSNCSAISRSSVPRARCRAAVRWTCGTRCAQARSAWPYRFGGTSDHGRAWPGPGGRLRRKAREMRLVSPGRRLCADRTPVMRAALIDAVQPGGERGVPKPKPAGSSGTPEMNASCNASRGRLLAGP